MDNKHGSKQRSNGRTNRKGKRNIQQKELVTLVDKLTNLINIFQINTADKIWERHLQLDEIVQEIIQIESSVINKKVSTSRQLNLDKYVIWLCENGAEFKGIEICEFDGYDLGLKATKNFDEGSLMLTVPSKIMMSVKNAEKSELAEFIEVSPLKCMPNIILALYLLLEKCNPDSFWKPYIDVLPEKYSTILYYSSDELKELRPSPAYASSLKLYQSIVKWYAYFHKRIFTMDVPVLKKLREIFTFENYRWAISSVMTRQNHIHLDEDTVTAFIPLWDMCNHEHGTITTDFNKDLSRGECYALRDFKPGEQIFIFYGARPNCDLFLHNGFVYPGNKHDSLSLAFGISPNDPLRDGRLALLDKLGLTNVTHYNLYQLPNPISSELLAFIRIFNINQEELEKIKSNESMLWDLVSSEEASAQVVGPNIDRRAYNYLLIRCGLIKASYKMDSVTDEPLSLHRRNIKLLKESEVRILEGAIEYLKDILSKLPAAET